MQLNVGPIERLVRFLIGLPMAVSYLYVRHFHLHWAYGLLAAGIILILTALMGQCPIHNALGTSTVRRENIPLEKELGSAP